MVAIYFPWFIMFVVIMWHQEKAARSKNHMVICARLLLLDKLSTWIHHLFVSTPRIAPMGRLAVHSSTTTAYFLSVNEKDSLLWLKRGLYHNHNHNHDHDHSSTPMSPYIGLGYIVVTLYYSFIPRWSLMIQVKKLSTCRMSHQTIWIN